MSPKLPAKEIVEARLPWSEGKVECNLCGHQWVAIWPLGRIT
jgi:hypothetical protein